MNKALRRYLESIGLSAEATEAQAWRYWGALTGLQRRRADQLSAGGVLDGGTSGGGASGGGAPVELRNMRALAVGDLEIDAPSHTIKNISVIQIGPALGHGFEVDATMLQQVADQINAKPKGVKSRLTHPGLTDCGGRDGIETTLGRVSNARVEGDKVRADLALGRFSAFTPAGDLRQFVMAIAEEDPELIGMSIVFDPAEFDSAVVDEPRAEAKPSSEAPGKYVVQFGRSNDVMASDIVGDPAANRDGLLQRLPDRLTQQITPRFLAQWAADLARLSGDQYTQPKPKRQAGAETPSRRIAMNKALRQYLESIGLSAEATDSEAVSYWEALTGDKRRKADELANPRNRADDQADEQADAQPEPRRLENGNGNGQANANSDQGEPAVNLADERRRATELERQRITEIHAMASELSLGDDWASEQVNSGASLSVVQQRALAALRERREAPGVTVTGGEDRNRASLTDAISDALMLRAGIPLYRYDDDGRAVLDDGGRLQRRDPHGRAREFRGLTLGEITRQFLQANQVTTIGLAQPRIAEMVFSRNQLAAHMGDVALAHSTSDFPSILANVANKTLRAGFAEAPRTWQRWARRTTTNDFKTIQRTQLGEMPNLGKVPEGGEIKEVTVGENKETYFLSKYGSIFRITWETIINDDLDAFSRIPRQMGAAAGRKEDILVYGVITSNPTMADGVALFHSSHSNLAGSGAAPSVSTLNAAFAAIGTQQGLTSDTTDPVYLELVPRFILHPFAIASTVDELIRSTAKPGANNDTLNVMQAALEPIMSARLDNNSTTAWYMACDNNQVDTVELAFLDGFAVPQVVQSNEFETLDRKYRVVHAIEAKAIDYRGLYKNPGS